MAEPIADRIHRYLLRAAEVRQVAETILDEECRRALELMAMRYERMAEVLEAEGQRQNC